MTWASLFLAAGIFIAALAVHVVWWRLHRPSDDLRALAMVMVAAPLAVTVGTGLLWGGIDLSQTAFSAIAAVSLGLAYLCWYPAAQAASPTMLLTLLAARKGTEGLSREEMEAALPEERLVNESVENLFHERFVRLDPEGRLWLDERGRRTLHVIRFLRRSCGLQDPRG
ncbi:MAG: hypothetical protein GVY10_11615 [Verrucomicrobia bacterium]|jgi:hypothetical protein|nr:hypothetical protein [Verrucomicrobiota bacterium]